MNLVFDVGVYMLVSSSIMVGYVWLRYVKHTQSEYEQMSNDNVSNEAQADGKNLAA